MRKLVVIVTFIIMMLLNEIQSNKQDQTSDSSNTIIYYNGYKTLEPVSNGDIILHVIYHNMSDNTYGSVIFVNENGRIANFTVLPQKGRLQYTSIFEFINYMMRSDVIKIEIDDAKECYPNAEWANLHEFYDECLDKTALSLFITLLNDTIKQGTTTDEHIQKIKEIFKWYILNKCEEKKIADISIKQLKCRMKVDVMQYLPTGSFSCLQNWVAYEECMENTNWLN